MPSLSVWIWSAEHGGALWAARLFAVALMGMAGLALGSRIRLGGARAAVVVALSCVFVEIVAGEVALRKLRAALASLPNADPAEVGAATIAVFTHRRDAALLAISDALDGRDDPDSARLAARAALHVARGDLAGAATLWMEHGRPELGAQTAESAGQWRLAARGYYLAGDFQRASDCFDRGAPGAPLDELRL